MGKVKESKNSKLFKELRLNEKFIADVKTFRKDFGIPPNGFKIHEAYAVWEEKYEPEYIEATIKVERIRFGYENKTMPASIKRKARISKFHLGLCKVLKRWNLSFEWYPSIQDYILFGRRQEKLDMHEAELRRESYNGIPLLEELVIKIGATISVKRFTKKYLGETIWNGSIDPLQKLMQGYKGKGQRPSKSKTKYQKRISKLLETKTDNELAGQPFMPGEPGTIRKHKSRLNAKFASKS
ncbi:MAG: hypothetical protein UU67_C0016G0011 [Candidatus Daviesbacteria bacterium GW2011_GWB1_41_5]|uniref:Uncharacterized protein n=1 Tax=Candidatus Daviesbacteria bacterium GW2011_GWB1_41_5 TaxID=1618429 RepID=A0A0G0ZLF0_9BACT|nr:MAG: hypothetical protein UU67_C0016G0011 [Candidatus Daviesbacteria bacterium GW2011_GWB1_41_5]